MTDSVERKRLYQGRSQRFKKGGGDTKKVRMLLHDIIEKVHMLLAQREIFEKSRKSTIFVLQQSFVHIFGVEQNF